MLDRTVEERHSKPFRLNLDDGKSLISHQWLDGSAVALWRTNPKSRFSIDADKLLFKKSFLYCQGVGVNKSYIRTIASCQKELSISQLK